MREPDSLDLHREPDGVLNLAPFSFFTVASRKPSFPKYKNSFSAPVTSKPSAAGVTANPSIR
jgi:hypothetical protein